MADEIPGITVPFDPPAQEEEEAPPDQPLYELEFVAHHLAVELVRGGVSKRAIEAALKSLAKKEGDRRAADMRTDCVNALLTERVEYEEDGEGYNVLGDAIDAIRSLPLEPTK